MGSTNPTNRRRTLSANTAQRHLIQLTGSVETLLHVRLIVEKCPRPKSLAIDGGGPQAWRTIGYRRLVDLTIDAPV